MPDMLVKLYDLPPLEPFLEKPRSVGVEIRKPIGPEKHVLIDWVRTHFNPGWASETEMGLMNRPISVFMATSERKVHGFACYDATVLGFFGPTGVAEEMRGKGIGAALLVATLHDMKAKGYAYAVIGGAGPTKFYEKAVGAVEIPGSAPGIYRDYVR